MNGRVVATFITATMLAACSGGTAETGNNNAAVEAPVAPDAPEADAAPPATPTAVAIGGAPTVDYMTGKWSAIDEDCADTLEFRKDGKVTTPIGDANWSLVGDKLTIDYGEGSKPTTTTVNVLSQERIEVTMASGRAETQKRC